jgi:hypothetical protein
MQTAKQYREALTDQIKAIAIVPTIVVIREHIGRNASSYFVERSTYER